METNNFNQLVKCLTSEESDRLYFLLQEFKDSIINKNGKGEIDAMLDHLQEN